MALNKSIMYQVLGIKLSLKKNTKYILRNTYYRKSAGFTLIELLAGLALAGFVLVLVASIYLAHFRLSSDQNTAIDTSVQNELAFNEITNQIRQSQAVVSTCTACGTDTTGANILILKLWPLDQNNNPQDPSGTNYDYIEYKLSPADPTQLIREIFPSPISTRTVGTRIVATNISSIVFSYDNADPTLATEITTTITTTKKTINGKTQTTTRSANAILRNK